MPTLHRAGLLMVIFLASISVLPKMSVGADDMTTIYVQESEVPIIIDGNITRAEWGKTQEFRFMEDPTIKHTVKQEGYFRVQHHRDNLILAGELLTDTTPQKDDRFSVGLKTGANPDLPSERTDYVVTINLYGPNSLGIASIPGNIPFRELVRGAFQLSPSFAHNESAHMNYEFSIPFQLLSFGLKENPSVVSFRTSIGDGSVPAIIDGKLVNYIGWPAYPQLGRFVFNLPVPEFNPEAVPMVAVFCLCCLLLALAKRKRNTRRRTFIL